MTETSDTLQIAAKGTEISSSIIEKVVVAGLRELDRMSHNSIPDIPPEKKTNEPMAAVTIDNQDAKDFAAELKAQGVDFQILKNQRENENIFVFKAKDYAAMERAFENYLYKVHPEIEREPEKEHHTEEQPPAQSIPELTTEDIKQERISTEWEHLQAQGYDIDYTEYYRMSTMKPEQTQAPNAEALEKETLIDKHVSILDKLQPKSNAPANLKEQQAAFKEFLTEKKAAVHAHNAALKLSKGPQQPDRGLDLD